MKKFNKAIQKIKNLRKYNKESDVIAKIISLVYLTTSTEKILHDKFNKNPEREVIHLINQSFQLFHMMKDFSKFQKKNFESLIEKKSVLKKHKQLWQNIWPAYESKFTENIKKNDNFFIKKSLCLSFFLVFYK